MRLFVSIELPEDVRRHLGHVQKRLEPIIKAKWTAPEQFHLTLKFLGETPDHQLPQIISALGGVRLDIPITLQTSGIVCFPSHGPIRIIAAALADEIGASGSLQSRIDEACHGAGFPLDARRWNPHVTIGRVKDRTGDSVRRVIAALAFSPLQFETEEFYLMESRPDQNGPKYVRLATFTIRGRGTGETRC